MNRKVLDKIDSKVTGANRQQHCTNTVYIWEKLCKTSFTAAVKYVPPWRFDIVLYFTLLIFIVLLVVVVVVVVVVVPVVLVVLVLVSLTWDHIWEYIFKTTSLLKVHTRFTPKY